MPWGLADNEGDFRKARTHRTLIQLRPNQEQEQESLVSHLKIWI